MSHSAQVSGATSARFKVLILLFALGAITYLDRLCIAAAAPAIIQEFHFSTVQMGYVFSAFTLAYALFEIPSGWLGDYIGTRKALTRIVLWWSAFTMLTGATIGFVSLISARLLFGAGEAGAFPNTTRSISRWFPVSQLGRALSLAFIGQSVGASVATPLVFVLVKWQSWRLTFVEFGLLGILWSAVWDHWFRDLPEEHAAVNADELKLIRADQLDDRHLQHTRHVPWKILLRSKNLACICAMYFAYGYGLYFYITWLPIYLLKGRGFSSAYAGFFSALPWVACGFGLWLGGWTTDWLVKRTGSLKLGRCGVGALGLAMSALALLGVANAENRVVAASLLALAASLQLVTGVPAWSVCLDVGRRNVGVVTGFMNTVGNLGGALAPVVTGYMVARWGSWTIPFYATASVLAGGVVMWLIVDPQRSVIDELDS
jgi:ACS family glucarate transporter-like MFS transporter